MEIPAEPGRESYRVLGTRVDVIQLPKAVERIVRWAAEKTARRRYVVTPNADVIATRKHPECREAIENADLCLADGYPVRLVGRLPGYRAMRRRCRCGDQKAVQLLGYP